MDTDKLPFWVEALQHLRPDQVSVHAGLAEQGEQIEQIITEAVWQKLEQDGLLERYRKEHGLPEDWAFGEEHIKEDDEADHEPLTGAGPS
jgi:hypothetical protein